MAKDTAFVNYPRSLSGVATRVATASAPPNPVVSGGVGGGAGMVQCDTCGLNLPRSASHIDVTTHNCFRGFVVSLTAAGHLSLA